jgi:serine/threonine-protein kinase RsbW
MEAYQETTRQSTEEELVIHSVVEEIAKVENFIDRLNEEFAFKADVYGNILVAVTEAVNNAIQHGNQQDATKKVRIKSRLVNDFLLAITVEDEGPGFDYENLKDPTDPEHLMEESGRGIFVMNHLADKIIFHDPGNTVEMQFNI